MLIGIQLLYISDRINWRICVVALSLFCHGFIAVCRLHWRWRVAVSVPIASLRRHGDGAIQYGGAAIPGPWGECLMTWRRTRHGGVAVFSCFREWNPCATRRYDTAPLAQPKKIDRSLCSASVAGNTGPRFLLLGIDWSVCGLGWPLQRKYWWRELSPSFQ